MLLFGAWQCIANAAHKQADSDLTSSHMLHVLVIVACFLYACYAKADTMYVQYQQQRYMFCVITALCSVLSQLYVLCHDTVCSDGSSS